MNKKNEIIVWSKPKKITRYNGEILGVARHWNLCSRFKIDVKILSITREDVPIP